MLHNNLVTINPTTTAPQDDDVPYSETYSETFCTDKCTITVEYAAKPTTGLTDKILQTIVTHLPLPTSSKEDEQSEKS